MGNVNAQIQVDDKVVDIVVPETLIQVDEALFNVDIDTRGEIAVTALKQKADDVVFNATVLGEGFEKLLDNDINRVANETYQSLLASMKQNIQSAVCRCLGFESRLGSWEVDHCNGRMGEVSSYISSKVAAAFRAEADKVIADESKTLFKGLHAAIRKEFKEEFLKLVRVRVRDAASESANAFIKLMIEQETVKLQDKAIKTIRDTLLNINDPKNDKVKINRTSHPLHRNT